MNIRHIASKVAELDAHVIAIPAFSDRTDPALSDLDKATSGRIQDRLGEENFTGKKGQATAIDTRDVLTARWVIVFGCGTAADFEASELRDLAARAVKSAQRRRAKSLALVLPGGRRSPAQVHFAALGARLALYKFDKYKKTDDSGQTGVERFDIVVEGKGKKPKAADGRSFSAEIKVADSVAAAIAMARDLVNEPAAVMTPTAMVEVARGLAKKHSTLKVKVLDRAQCEKLGMGMFLAVAQGSAQEPKFIHLSYTPKKKAKGAKRIALVGKGVMFDSGGYSIKPSPAMEDMKIDMAGSAAVISSMGAIAELGLGHEVHAIAACCENMVSGHAYRLGDVLTAMDGTTVEINNTDAEGRLTLGDAITYVREHVKPDEMFDFATLTGACMVALGPNTAGVFSRHDRLVKAWLAAAARSGESMWQMPLEDRLKEQLKSPIAEMRNTGDRWGGAITAGLFLAHFVKDTPWVHVDLAGPASTARESAWNPKGGTGYGVATILDYLRS